jgi:adenylate kinase
VKERIVLLGPPASGKGTQAEMIRTKYNLPIASPGSILREEKRNGSPLGLEADELTSQGHLVPDGLVNEVVADWLERHQGGVVFDGYPRSRGQADALDGILSKSGRVLDLVLFLQIDLLTIQQRVANRLMCADCGWIGSIGLNVSNADAGCPFCSGSLIKRKDDTPDTLKARMAEYGKKTEPLISQYRERGILCSVDAGRARELVFDSISEILETE